MSYFNDACSHSGSRNQHVIGDFLIKAFKAELSGNGEQTRCAASIQRFNHWTENFESPACLISTLPNLFRVAYLLVRRTQIARVKGRHWFRFTGSTAMDCDVAMRVEDPRNLTVLRGNGDE